MSRNLSTNARRFVVVLPVIDANIFWQQRVHVVATAAAQQLRHRRHLHILPKLQKIEKHSSFPVATVSMSDNLKVMFSTATAPEEEMFQPPAPLLAGAHVNGMATYVDMYRQSLDDPKKFWRSVAEQLHFEVFSDNGLEWNFDHRKGEIFVHFMAGSRTNIAYNCLERNIKAGIGDRVAFRWEGNEPGDERTITYQQLLDQVVMFAAVLRARGVRAGDVVSIYLPMVMELPVAMLACARIGAIHSVVFAGFSADSLAQRIMHTHSRLLITADGCYRGNKLIQLKTLADQAAEMCAEKGHPVEHMIVVEHLCKVSVPRHSAADNGNGNGNGTSAQATTTTSQWDAARDVSWDAAMAAEAEKHSGAHGAAAPVEWVDAEHPLFILYTSGSTGVPKGILHTTAGYMCYVYMTTKCSFDAHADRDVYWCTADCGWITGHSYVVYGPLLNGLTSVIFEGVPSYPDTSRMWDIVEKYKITKLYTAPTAVRALMAFSDEMVTKHDRSSLQVIGSVGEPINPSAWKWLYTVVGEERCAIVDTYWQTETGGHVLTPLPGATPTKPGAATLPFFGIVPRILDAEGRHLEGPADGSLCFARPWPGIARTAWGDHERFVKTYFTPYPGHYFTGDGARRDEDNYYWITGRMDDLMNVSGHLLSTAEIESALVHHSDVVEAAVVSVPHPIKGHCPYAFVTLSNGKQFDDQLVRQLKELVRLKIGAIAVPDVVQKAPGLPKTRSGKVTRRILRKIAEGDTGADLGDTSTLVDEAVIEQLWQGRLERGFCNRA
ncbi:hypothetical protein niasHT_033010 [Heterodera trifolii]|uniref:acetate--CoA ligase n=1 Tax=Heterodera trifolii TaxID=157864 RepID=A0ABD2IHB8_9BILA